MKFSLTLQDKFGILIAAIITVVLADLSFFFYLQLDNSLMDSLRTKLVVVSKIVSSQISPEMIPKIVSGDEKSAAYWELKKYLKGIQLLDKKVKNIRVLVKTKKTNAWKFLADEEFDPKKMVHLNELYDVTPYKQMQYAFSGSIADEKTREDRWGRWLSGYAPVYDRQGRAIAVVAVGMSADEVDQMRGGIRDLVIISFAIGLALAIIFGRIGAITITNPILALVRGIKNIEEGKYGTRIDLTSRDEIGKLIAGFNKMSSKLGEVDKLKTEFLSVISHELYTPITPIKESASQLVESRSISDTDRQLVSIISRQTDKLQVLVDEVLDFSLLDVREWKLNKEPAVLNLIGEAAIEQIKNQADKKSIKVKLKLADELPTVMVDKKRIQHVTKILLENALKFSPDGGELILQVNKVSGGVEISIKDMGIGIARDNLEKIFSGFYQVEDHMTRTKGGMGLGLAIAKRIVEAHNGYIWAESGGLGEGSRFVFLLPIV